jgi:hypothetical protein
MNPWAGRTMLYWDEFAPILQRNRAPNANLRFHPPHRNSPQDIVTIVDANYPLRNYLINTGYSEDDWQRDSIVCNASWLNGEIPLRGRFIDPKTDRPVRGVVEVLGIMLHNGCLCPTSEISYLLGGDARRAIPDKYSTLRLLT